MPSPPSDHLLRTLASIPVDSRVLVVGCDEGRHVHPLLRLGFDVYTIDPDPDAVARLRKELVATENAETGRTVSQARPQALGFPDEFFDWVILYRAFGRANTPVDDLVEALTEMRRVLKPGGWAYVAIDTGAHVDADDEHVLGFYGLMRRANLELAEKAEVVMEQGTRLVRGIFRRVDETTPL